MVEEIRRRVHEAAGHRNKIAMFHFLVLIHADELGSVGPLEFCRGIGVPDSYAVEFRKMVGLARLIRNEGYSIEGKGR